MAISTAKPSIWEDIELSESYLVCCMYEEAASLACSVLERLRDGEHSEDVDGAELFDTLVSAGMVLVQSLKEAGRTSEALGQLKILFESVAAIPVEVFLTGVCFQISEGPSSGVREFLEEFLSSWRYVNGQHYVLASAETNIVTTKYQLELGIDRYLEVVDVYVVTLLASVLGDMGFAISWVEKAALPEEERQEILRRLHSLYSLKVTSLSQSSMSPLLGDEREVRSSPLKASNPSGVSKEGQEVRSASNGEKDVKQTVLKFSGHRVPWWFRTISLKFGNARCVISNGNVLLGSFLFLMFFVIRRKRTTLKSSFRRHTSSVKKALIDLWQLAFSYQVNPLAAVQPLPAATRGSR